MIKPIKKLIFAILFLSPIILLSQKSEKELGLESINMDVIKGPLEFLASDWTEGRGTGEKGSFMAADYIQSMFKVYGVKPAGDVSYSRLSRAQRTAGESPQQLNSYFQDFSLVKFKAAKNQTFQIIKKAGAVQSSINLNYKTDYTFNFSDISNSIESEVIFAGYGYTDKSNGYDDYKNIDVKGKIVLIISGFPGHQNKASDAFKKFSSESNKNTYYLSRNKRDWAEKNGAVGIIEYSSNNSAQDQWATNFPIRFESRGYEGDEPLSVREYSMRIPGSNFSSNILRIGLSKRALNEIIKDSGIDLEQFENMAAQKMKPASRVIPNIKINLKANVESEIIKARNVLGMIEGEDLNDIIVIGGHYDHLGMSNGFIWNGADDDASGVIGMLTIAKAIQATGKKPKRTIIFAAWTGEEKGLLGSKYFVQSFKPLDRITYNLNMDMISRNNPGDKKGNQLTMKVTKGNDFFEQLTRQNIADFKLNLEVIYNPIDPGTSGGGSDYVPFCAEYIPFFSFNAGFEPFYHHYDDETSTLNWEKMLTIVKLGFLNIWDLANY